MINENIILYQKYCYEWRLPWLSLHYPVYYPLHTLSSKSVVPCLQITGNMPADNMPAGNNACLNFSVCN